MLEYKSAICPYCSCGCGMHLVIKDGRIIGIEPWKEHPVSQGSNCPKGRHANEYLYHPDRLTKPLLKKDGEFKPISWEQAFEVMAENFKDTKPEEFGAVVSAKTTNEEGYIIQKFVRVAMKTNSVEYCARFCHSATVAGLGPTVGSGVMEVSELDLDKVTCFLVWGVNIKETFPMITKRVLRAKQKGAKVVVIDPRKTLSAQLLADIHLQLKPGSDIALANAMMKVILEEGLENKEFIEKRTAGFDELKRYLDAFSLEKAQEITGVSLELIKESARLYAQAKVGTILYDEGITQHICGGDNVKAMADLALLCGQFSKPGAGVSPMRGQINGEGSGDMGCVNVFYPGFKRVGDETVKYFEEAWGVKGLPSKPGLTYMDIIHKCPVVYVIGTNPMVAGPDLNEVKKSLSSKKFLVVQDIFMTETAKLAHLILPACAWVEREGVYAYIDRRVQKINKLVEPPGEAKPDWWIICQLGKKMGYEKQFNFNSAGEIFEEIRKVVPQYAGLTYEKIESTPGGIQWPCPKEDHPGTPTMFMEKFNTPDGKGHFQVVKWIPPAETPDQEYPFILTTGRNLFHYHSGTMTLRTESLRKEVAEVYVQINPEDADQLGVREGQEITISSRRGEIRAKVWITEQVTKGMVFLPFHFGDQPANLLTNPASDPSCKMPEFKVCAVKIQL